MVSTTKKFSDVVSVDEGTPVSLNDLVDEYYGGMLDANFCALAIVGSLSRHGAVLYDDGQVVLRVTDGELNQMIDFGNVTGSVYVCKDGSMVSSVNAVDGLRVWSRSMHNQLEDWVDWATI